MRFNVYENNTVKKNKRRLWRTLFVSTGRHFYKTLIGSILEEEELDLKVI